MSNHNLKLVEYTKIFKDILAKDIMTREVVVMAPDKKVNQAKEMMRIKRITGIPIVDPEKNLIGIISIEDIIYALETNNTRAPIKSIMTTDVVAINENDNLLQVVELFEKYKFGRFPVVDASNKLTGIITREDILHGILERFKNIYIHDQKRSEILNSDYSLITGQELDLSRAEFHFHIDSSDINNAGIGAATLRQFLMKKNLAPDFVRRAGIATYEAETNVVIHSKSDGDIYCFLEKDKLIVRVIDNGIGIEDLEVAMKEGYSTAPDYVREFGFGAGMGLPNIKRFADKLVILSEKNSGTQVEMVFFIMNEPNHLI